MRKKIKDTPGGFLETKQTQESQPEEIGVEHVKREGAEKVSDEIASIGIVYVGELLEVRCGYNIYAEDSFGSSKVALNKSENHVDKAYS